MANTRGIFTLRYILEEKIPFDEWVSLDDVWIDYDPVPTPNTGYFGGGFLDNVGGITTMDKVTYSTDTTAEVPGAALSAARHALAATGNSTHGYFGGGQKYPGSTNHTTMDKVTYSSDITAAVPGANLSVARKQLAATGNSTAGYFGGGLPSGATMDKVTYSSDTTAAVPGANLSAARYGVAATGNSDAGYFSGGKATYSTMDKVTYSTDTTAEVPGAALSAGRYGLAATGNSTAGYFGGGFRIYPNPRMTTVDKVTYSTDTTAALPSSADLSLGRYNLGATGNSDAGYFGGGFSYTAVMDKTTYASDTTAAVPGANLSVARYGVAASSSRANALPTTSPAPESTRFSDGRTEFVRGGYFGGGGPGPLATMDKVTYS
jgi:hypothetical protein